MNAIEKREFPKTVRPGMIRALRRHYSGQTIVEAFSDDDTPARATYYKLKAEFPDEMLTLSEQARQLALQDTELEVAAFDAEQFRHSVGLQRRATQAFEDDILQRLIDIAKGGVFEHPTTDKDGRETTRVIIPYPRDIVEAAKLLLQITKEGTVGNIARYARLAERVVQQASPVSKPMSPLGVRTDFDKISGTTAEGRVIEVSLSEVEDVIEAELVEDGEAGSPSS